MTYQDKKIKALFDLMDINGNNQIDFHDFIKHALYLKKKRRWEDDSKEFKEIMDAKSTFWAILTHKGGVIKEDDLPENPREPSEFKLKYKHWLKFWDNVREEFATGKQSRWLLMVLVSIFKNINATGGSTIEEREYNDYLDSIEVPGKDDVNIGNLAEQKRSEAWNKISRGKDYIEIDDMFHLLQEWLESDQPDPEMVGDLFATAGYKTHWE